MLHMYFLLKQKQTKTTAALITTHCFVQGTAIHISSLKPWEKFINSYLCGFKNIEYQI